MKILKKIMFTAFFMLLAAGVSIAITTEDDLSELTRIAGLQGESYLVERDRFVQSHPNPVDMDKAIERGWSEGLLTLIVNARIAKPEWFQGWDKSIFIATRSGAPSWSPNPAPYNDPTNLDLRQNINIFIIEKLWKFYESSLNIEERRNQKSAIPKGIWPKIVLDKEMNKYIKGTRYVPGPAALWRKVALETTNHQLPIVAYDVLASDESELNREIIESKLQQVASEDIKKAIMSSMEYNKPKYSATVLLKTYHSWKQNLDVALQGFRVLTKQPVGSNSRNFLKEIVMDPNQSIDLREKAVSALSIRLPRDPHDITFLHGVLDSSEHIKLRRKAAKHLTYYQDSLTRTIMYKVLETETDQFILNQGIKVVEHLKDNEDSLKHLEKFLKRQDIPEESRKRAKIAKDRVANIIKAKKFHTPPGK